MDKTNKTILKDTIASSFFSTDQQFEVIREICPIANQNFEGLIYHHYFIGFRESRYCNGIIKRQEFYYNSEPIGISKEYDSIGNFIKEKDYGKKELFNKFRNIKYYR